MHSNTGSLDQGRGSMHFSLSRRPPPGAAREETSSDHTLPPSSSFASPPPERPPAKPHGRKDSGGSDRQIHATLAGSAEGGRLVAGMATTTVEAWLGRRRQGCKRRAGSGPPEADLATRRSDWASSQRGQRSSQRWVGDNGRALSRSAHRGRSMAA